MVRHDHPTTEEQTGYTKTFVQFVTSQNLEVQIKVAALLKERQTLTKPYSFLLKFCCFLSQQ
jgi:hypothetical protein